MLKGEVGNDFVVGRNMELFSQPSHSESIVQRAFKLLKTEFIKENTT